MFDPPLPILKEPPVPIVSKVVEPPKFILVQECVNGVCRYVYKEVKK